MDSLSLVAKHTHGHSVGGITYVIDGLEKPVAVVGDAIFAGSMGGGMVSYKDALRTNREKIMSLTDDTILCPGHGPLTTVGEENRITRFSQNFLSECQRDWRRKSSSPELRQRSTTLVTYLSGTSSSATTRTDGF